MTTSSAESKSLSLNLQLSELLAAEILAQQLALADSRKAKKTAVANEFAASIFERHDNSSIATAIEDLKMPSYVRCIFACKVFGSI